MSEWLLWWVSEWLLWWVSEGLLWGPHVPNSYAVVTLFGVDGLLLFLMVFHHKSMVRSSYMMMTMLIICYRDPMCQIHTQW